MRRRVPILCFILSLIQAATACVAQTTATPTLITFEDDFSGYKPGTFPAANWKNNDSDKQNLLFIKKESNGNSLAISNKIYSQSVRPLFNVDNADVVRISFSFSLETLASEIYIHGEGPDGKLDCICAIRCADERMLELYNFHARGLPGWINVKIPVDFATGIWHQLTLNLHNGDVICFVDNHKAFTQSGYYHFYDHFAVGVMLFAEFTNFKLTARVKEAGVSTLLTASKLITHAINFDVNAATIKPGSMPFLTQLADILKSTKIRLEIDGHTDSDGDDDKNITLSKTRAVEVRKALMAKGIDSNRLETKGYGADKPLMPNTTAGNKAMNRRVEFIKLP